MDDIKEFHKENSDINKKHYTYMARVTQMRAVNFFQSKAARVHFNPCEIEHPDGKIKARYGVLAYDDLLRDLSQWESMLASSFL